MRRVVAALLLLATLACAATALAELTGPEAAILTKVEQTYRGMGPYIFEGSIHVDIQKAGSPQTQHADFLAARGTHGRMRDEVDNPAVGGAFVSDGRQTWVYNASMKQYVHKMGSSDSVLAGLGARGIAGSLILRYGGVTTGATAVKRLPDESVTLDGKPRPCDVLEVTYPQSTPNPQIQEGPRTYWIDRQTHLVLRQRTKVTGEVPQLGGHIEQTETISFKRAQLDPMLDDDLWTFKPPAGAKEVDKFQQPTADESSALEGKPSIDFALKDLAGKPHTLKALRGKVVLLDFWATWCGPCRMTMPRVAKIHKEYRAKGVEVLSINVGETAAKAGEYVKKNGYTFTTLLDIDRVVSNDYKVNGIPTLVVIDKTGKVSSYLVGAHEEQTLRDALAKAGVK